MEYARAEAASAGSGAVVIVRFTQAGTQKFHRLAAQTAALGPIIGAPAHFAIVLDGELRSWPYLDYKAHPRGLPGSTIAIVAFSLHEARELALAVELGTQAVSIDVHN